MVEWNEYDDVVRRVYVLGRYVTYFYERSGVRHGCLLADLVHDLLLGVGHDCELLVKNRLVSRLQGR